MSPTKPGAHFARNTELSKILIHHDHMKAQDTQLFLLILVTAVE